MRDPNRIYDIMKRITEIWATHPDLRLGQLILNAVDRDVLYHIEDDVVLAKIDGLYSTIAALNASSSVTKKA